MKNEYPAALKFFEAGSQRKTRGHSWKIVKQRNCLDFRKCFFSARVVDTTDWIKLMSIKKILTSRL